MTKTAGQMAGGFLLLGVVRRIFVSLTVPSGGFVNTGGVLS